MAIQVEKQSPYAPLYTDRGNHFIILITGGRGSAKSFNATLFSSRLAFDKNHKILFCRYTMTSAKDSIIPEFMEKLQMDGTERYFKIANNNALNLYSGSEIMFRGIKTSSGNQTANLKSITGLTTFFGDEMEEWQSEKDYDTLVLSIRKKNVDNRVVLIMNPTDSDHFIYKKYIEKTHRTIEIDGVDVQISTHPKVLHIHTTYFDNKEHLSEEFLSIVEETRNKSILEATVNGKLDKTKFNKTKYATKIIGRWSDVKEGAILENWIEGEFNEYLPYGYGMDFGFSIDPDTLIKVAIDEKRKLIYLKEEYYKRGQLSTDQLSEMVKSRIKNPNDLIVADSAEPRLISDMRGNGLNIQAAKKGQGSVSAGIKKLLDYTIIVTPESVNAKREFKNYIWNDKRAGIPMDKDNHIPDALRYIVGRLSEGTSDLESIANIL